MLAATVLTGVAAGVGGALLTLLLHLVQHLGFGYTERTFLVGVQQASRSRRVVAVTVGGALAGLGWRLHRRRYARESVSVTGALRARSPALPFAATVTDAVLQILAVGAGASLGREGAPRQVGAACAAWIGRRTGLAPAQRRTLLACGAGAGLAAVYNVPVGGAVFTVEVLLASVALRDLLPAAMTSAIATAVAWPVLTTRPTYELLPLDLHAPVLVWALLLGPLAGAVGVVFTRLMTAARARAPRDASLVASVALAFAAVGLVAGAYPEVLGNGKGPAELSFTGTMSLGLAAALVVLKPLATAICLRGGAIGGLLTPALATGAALGVLTGRLWDAVWPGAGIGEYAVVGAAALLAVTQRAPLTAVVLTLELVATGLPLLPPVIAAVGLAVVTAGLLDEGTAPTGLVTALRRRRETTSVPIDTDQDPSPAAANRSAVAASEPAEPDGDLS